MLPWPQPGTTWVYVTYGPAPHIDLHTGAMSTVHSTFISEFSVGQENEETTYFCLGVRNCISLTCLKTKKIIQLEEEGETRADVANLDKHEVMIMVMMRTKLYWFSMQSWPGEKKKEMTTDIR
jgi:hypothetical protein